MVFLTLFIMAHAQPLLETLSWYTIHDTVMGGVSKGSIQKTRDSLHFSGYLSLDNNGGFASIRSDVPPSQLNTAQGIQMRIRGDGRSYIATIRLDGEDRRIYYRLPFDTQKDIEQDIILPFAQFFPYAFGRALPNIPAPLFSQNPLQSVGIMLADKQQGDFSLHLISIEPYGSKNLPPIITREQKESIYASISIGVPTYNKGDVLGCANQYKKTLQSLQKDLQSPWLKEVLASSFSDANTQAWWYRHALDRLASNSP